MKLWLSRQANGQYMLTALPPMTTEVGSLGYEDVYVVPGDPVGLRNLCPLMLKLIGEPFLSRLESIEIELEGRKV